MLQCVKRACVAARDIGLAAPDGCRQITTATAAPVVLRSFLLTPVCNYVRNLSRQESASIVELTSVSPPSWRSRRG
jgi:hypothetical protein